MKGDSSFFEKHQQLTRQAYENPDTLPHRYVFILTNQCNLKCSFCFQDKDKRKDAMTPGDWIALVDQIPNHSRITMTGGEPLMFRDFRTVFSYAAKRHECNLLTNGTLLSKDMIDFLLSFKNFKVLSISLDDVKNRLRPINDSTWQSVEETLTYFTKRRNEEKKDCLLDCKTVVLDANGDRLLDIHKYCVEQMNCDTHVFQMLKGSPLQHADTMYSLDDAFKKSKMEPYKKFDSIVEEFEKIRQYSKRNKTRVYVHPKIAQFDSDEAIAKSSLMYFNVSEHIKSDFLPCMFPWSSVHINVDGNLFPCLAVSMGNVKETPLKDIVQGKQFVRFKEMIKTEGTIEACNHCGYLHPKHIWER